MYSNNISSDGTHFISNKLTQVKSLTHLSMSLDYNKITLQGANNMSSLLSGLNKL